MTRQTTTLQLTNGTQIVVVVNRHDRNLQQLDMFEDQQEAWAKDMIDVAKRMPVPFFFSELRLLAAHEPPHASWWGALSRQLKRSGFVQTSTFRRSPRRSRRGGLDFQYDRKAAVSGEL